jgi:hypothetical protein
MPIAQLPARSPDQRSRRHNGNRNGEVVQRREGLGFITPDHHSKDVFVHHSAIIGEAIARLSRAWQCLPTPRPDPRGLSRERSAGLGPRDRGHRPRSHRLTAHRPPAASVSVSVRSLSETILPSSASSPPAPADVSRRNVEQSLTREPGQPRLVATYRPRPVNPSGSWLTLSSAWVSAARYSSSVKRAIS